MIEISVPFHSAARSSPFSLERILSIAHDIGAHTHSPMTTRPISSTGNEGASAHRTEPTTPKVSIGISTRRWPMMSAERADSPTMTAVAMLRELIAQLVSAEDRCSAAAILPRSGSRATPCTSVTQPMISRKDRAKAAELVPVRGLESA
jgi:hypothetical protein